LYCEPALKPYNFELTLSQALFGEMNFDVAANQASALEWPMPQLYISEVARQVGLRPSAIRYYEQIGLLPPAPRLGKQRRYDTTALYRLAIIQRARQLGFTLDEIRQLFFGFSTVTRASVRWQKLSQRKLEELDNLMDGMKAVRRLLKKMMQNCCCETLDQCGKGIFRSGGGELVVKSLPANRRYSVGVP
jgi:MerR family redox-sensitive transcriptional activator SoxR